MTEMVERVARALAVADGMHPDAVSNDEDQVPVWKLYVDDARAAIEAMRVPTEAMETAGWEQLPDRPDDWSPVSAYERMIDAALSPNQKE